MFILRVNKVLNYGLDVVLIGVNDVSCLEAWITVSFFLDIINAYLSAKPLREITGDILFDNVV
jgi:hypothetical protein